MAKILRHVYRLGDRLGDGGVIGRCFKNRRLDKKAFPHQIYQVTDLEFHRSSGGNLYITLTPVPATSEEGSYFCNILNYIYDHEITSPRLTGGALLPIPGRIEKESQLVPRVVPRHEDWGPHGKHPNLKDGPMHPHPNKKC